MGQSRNEEWTGRRRGTDDANVRVWESAGFANNRIKRFYLKNDEGTVWEIVFMLCSVGEFNTAPLMDTHKSGGSQK